LRKILIAVLLVLIAVAGTLWWLVTTPLTPPGECFVQLESVSGTLVIAGQLEEAGVVRSRYAFVLAKLLRHGKLKAGEYRFTEAATPFDIYDRIARGDVFTIPVTIPEGSNLYDIAARLAAAHLFSAEDFLQAAEEQTALISDLDPGAASLEGYLFPDTYLFPRHITAEQAVQRMVRRFRLAAKSIGLQSPTRSVVTVASLIERETPIAEERPFVASVFENRLEKGMPLMTDPSVIYGLELAGRWRGRIYASDLSFDTPYNTYKHAGLPPGPVSNPGLTSLKAAMNPAQSNYLYFVAASADPSGHSRFATTLDEHNRNVASYRKAEKAATQPVPPPVVHRKKTGPAKVRSKKSRRQAVR
jgi:UPF0755 protein